MTNYEYEEFEAETARAYVAAGAAHGTTVKVTWEEDASSNFHVVFNRRPKIRRVVERTCIAAAFSSAVVFIFCRTPIYMATLAVVYGAAMWVRAKADKWWPYVAYADLKQSALELLQRRYEHRWSITIDSDLRFRIQPWEQWRD